MCGMAVSAHVASPGSSHPAVARQVTPGDITSLRQNIRVMSLSYFALLNSEVATA